MNATLNNGVVPGTCTILQRRLLTLVLVFSLISFSGALFLPQQAMAAQAKPAAKTVVSKKNTSQNAKKTVTTAKKRRKTPYVRSLTPEAERLALRDRGISSGFGLRAISKRATRMHKGIDLPAPKDSKIVAFNDGEIIFAGRKNGYGIAVIVKQLDGREALYAHMNKATVRVGETVRRGDHIGHVGRTGRATGYHLHFEIIDEGKNLDPAEHVWHSAELIIRPGDLDPRSTDAQTKVASPNTPKANIH